MELFWYREVVRHHVETEGAGEGEERERMKSETMEICKGGTRPYQRRFMVRLPVRRGP